MALLVFRGFRPTCGACRLWGHARALGFYLLLVYLPSEATAASLLSYPMQLPKKEATVCKWLLGQCIEATVFVSRQGSFSVRPPEGCAFRPWRTLVPVMADTIGA
jgi:hypothetical protein